MIIKIFRRNQTKEIIEYLEYLGKRIYYLFGDIGVGKTTLIRSIVGEEVYSPTFSCLNVYSNDVWHYDFYQVEIDKNLLFDIDFFYALEYKRVFIEWSEKLPIKILNTYKGIKILITQNSVRINI